LFIYLFCYIFFLLSLSINFTLNLDGDLKSLIDFSFSVHSGALLSQFYPALYVPTAQSQQTPEICSRLGAALSKSGIDAFCPQAEAISMIMMGASASAAAAPKPNNGTGPTSTEIARYQIALWVSILLVVAVFVAVTSIMFMSFKKDTLLYGSFNPNWEESRKSR
jgi:hypothetical protein